MIKSVGNAMHIDSQLAHLLTLECDRQRDTISLIASENYVSHAVLQVTASVLTNKYAEGYSGKRYYPGCSVVDQVELLAIDRCKKLFGVDHVNVQPHAGSQANMAVFYALLKPQDTILGMSLAAGGHLTHGHGVNFSGNIYKSIQYSVNQDTELIDFEEIERLAQQHRPKLIIAGASSYSRAIDFKRFKEIASSVGAYLMADIAHIAGLVATKQHPTPVGYADVITSTTHKTLRGPRGGLIMCNADQSVVVDRAIIPGTQGGPFMHTIAGKAAAFYEALQPSFEGYQKQVVKNAFVMARAFQELGYRVVSGGTDNHMFVLDLRNKGVTGLQAEQALEAAGITVSRSCIPFDPQKPWITSGIRIGTPALTTRGLQESEALILVDFIDTVIKHYDNPIMLNTVRNQVKKMMHQARFTAPLNRELQTTCF